jgi:hypothetical protein
MLYLALGRWSWGGNRPKRYWTNNGKVWGCRRYHPAKIVNISFHQVILLFHASFSGGKMKNKNKKNGISSLGHFLWMNILQARMSTRWRQLLILSTNQQESASFAQKKGLNSGTRIVLFSCWEQNCEHQFHHALMLILLCSYINRHTFVWVVQCFHFSRAFLYKRSLNLLWGVFILRDKS